MIFTKKCKLALAIMILAVLSASGIHAQEGSDLPESLGNSLGIYKINTKESEPGFEDFLFFRMIKFPKQDEDNPKVDSSGFVRVDGWVHLANNKVYKFSEAKIKQLPDEYYEDIEFRTETIDGVSYSFKGAFQRNMVHEKDGGYTRIRGILSKYKDGLETRSRDLPFYQEAYL